MESEDYMDDDLQYIGTNYSPPNTRRVTRSLTRNKNCRSTKIGRKVQDQAVPMETVDLTDEKKPREKKKILVDDWLEITDDEDSEEEEELEEVKALWNNALNKIERFPVKRKDPLLPIFEYFAKLNNVNVDRIQIQTNTFKQIHKYDSVETLNFKVTNFLIASLISEQNMLIDKTVGEEHMIEVKCQFKGRKHPLICRIHCNQPFSTVAEQCAAQIGLAIDKIKLHFDGESLSFNESPKSLEFEGGECIDVIVPL